MSTEQQEKIKVIFTEYDEEVDGSVAHCLVDLGASRAIIITPEYEQDGTLSLDVALSLFPMEQVADLLGMLADAASRAVEKPEE